MSAETVIAIGVLAGAAAHGWFLRHTKRVIPQEFAALWMACFLATHADRVGVPIWVAAVGAVIGAIVSAVWLPRLVRGAVLAEAGVVAVRGSHADLQRAAELDADLGRLARYASSPPRSAPPAPPAA